jgi:N-acetylglucosamine-6-phosphate deacetylase
MNAGAGDAKMPQEFWMHNSELYYKSVAEIFLEGNLPGVGHALVEIQADRIARVTVEGPEQAGAPILSPGLVDIQVNGFAGIDFSDPRLEPERAIAVLPHLWRTGVTSFCPTLITNSRENFTRNFRVFEKARGMDPRFAASVPCYHLEGPYISPGGSRGVHEPTFMHPPDWGEFQEWQGAAGGNIGIVTLAPELPGALDFIARARDSGVVVALGHTDAAPEQIHAAVDAGAQLSTHLGNGCPQMLDRHANMLWPQMARAELSASLICDTFHLPADVVKVMLAAKGIARCILITDAMYVATLPPGRYPIVGTEIELLPGGKVIKADGACLGGSAVTMNREAVLFMRMTGAPLADAIQASTANPAALLNRGLVCARVAAGAPANLLLSRFDSEGLQVESTWLRGERVYRARS